MLAAHTAPRRTIWSWWSWDLASTSLNSVMISFVFSVYVTGTVAANPTRGQDTWANAQTIAGILLALLAPLMGAWADRVRNRRRMLSVTTVLVIATMSLCWFVRPHDQYLLLGVTLLSLASILQDIAAVFYNGMLLQISTASNIGRISSIGWGFGYFGGVFCLIAVLFGFVLNGGLLGLPTAERVNIRAIALFSGAFMLVFSLPVMIWGPAAEKRSDPHRFNAAIAYRDIAVRVARMWRHERSLLHFLVASAIYRDGLTAVFSFGGVIAASSFGFTSEQVIYFGLAANVVALAGTWSLSGLDDRIGPWLVIIGSLGVMIVAGFVVIAWHTTLAFWICGLLISSLVGIVQSASRTLLARIVPAGEENETFGLYATVGRVASFIAPAFIGIFTQVLGVRWGILGIVVTLLVGLVVFMFLRIESVTHHWVRQAS